MSTGARELLVWVPSGNMNSDAHKDAITHGSGDYTLLYDLRLHQNEQGEDMVLNPFVSALMTYEIPPAKNKDRRRYYIKKRRYPDTSASGFQNTPVRLEFYDINMERFGAAEFYDLATLQSAINLFNSSGFSISIINTFAGDDEFEFGVILELTQWPYYEVMNIAATIAGDATHLYQYGLIDEAYYVFNINEKNSITPMFFTGYVPFEDGFFAFYTSCPYRYYEVECSIENFSPSPSYYFEIVPDKFLDIPIANKDGAQYIHYCEIISEHIDGPNPHERYFDGVWPMYYDGQRFVLENIGINTNGYVFNNNVPNSQSKIKLKVGHITYGRIYYFKRLASEITPDGTVIRYEPQLIYDGMGMGFNTYHKTYGQAMRMSDEVMLTFHRWRLGEPTQIIFKNSLSPKGLNVHLWASDLSKENGYYNLPYFSLTNRRFPSAYENSQPAIKSTKIVDRGGKIRPGPKKYYIKYRYRGDTIYRFKIFHKEIIAYSRNENGSAKTINGGDVNSLTDIAVEIELGIPAAKFSEFHVGCIEKTGPMSFTTMLLYSWYENSSANMPNVILHDTHENTPDDDMLVFLEKSNVIYDIDSIEICNNRMFFGNFTIHELPPPYITNRSVQHGVGILTLQNIALRPSEILDGHDWYKADGGIESYDVRGFCINEIYKFGVLGISHNGYVSPPRWLTDVIVDLNTNINNPRKDYDAAFDMGDRATGMGTSYFSITINEDVYANFIAFRQIYRTLARNRYRDFVFIRDDRYGRVAHNSIGFLTQIDVDSTFSRVPVHYIAAPNSGDPVSAVNANFPCYLTFNRTAFPLNFAGHKNAAFSIDKYNSKTTGFKGDWTVGQLLTGAYVVFGPEYFWSQGDPYEDYFLKLTQPVKYTEQGSGGNPEFWGAAFYGKQQFDHGFLENTVIMLFSPEDLLLGPKEINADTHKLYVFQGTPQDPTTFFTTKVSAKQENRWKIVKSSDLMGSSDYQPKYISGLIPQIINIIFHGEYREADIAIKDINQIKYVSRGNQATFPKQTGTHPHNKLPRFVYGKDWYQPSGNPNIYKFDRTTLSYDNYYQSAETEATIAHYVIDKKDASFIWACYPAKRPKDLDNLNYGSGGIATGDMWVPNSMQFVNGYDLFDFFNNVTNGLGQFDLDMLDVMKNNHLFYYETESGYVVQVKPESQFFTSDSGSVFGQVQKLYNKSGYIFFCQIINTEAYRKAKETYGDSFQNAIVVHTIEKAFEGDAGHMHGFECKKGDTFMNVITHKLAYPRKTNFYYNQIDEDNTLLGTAIRYIIPSFVNFAARNVQFNAITDGASTSNKEAPSWPQNQHTLWEYVPNYNNDNYAIDPMYANDILPYVVKADAYDHKKVKKERHDTLLCFSNPLQTRNDFGDILNIIPQNIRNMPLSGGEITNLIDYGAYLLVMQRNSFSQFIKAHNNVVVTPHDGDEILLRSASDVNIIPGMTIGYSAQQKDAWIRIGRNMNNLSLFFFDSYKGAIVQLVGNSPKVRSSKISNLFKRKLDVFAGAYNERRFGVYCFYDPRAEEVVFVFRPKPQLAKPWMQSVPGISAPPDANVFDIVEQQAVYFWTYYGDQNIWNTGDDAIVLPNTFPPTNDETNFNAISILNDIPRFYFANVPPDTSILNQAPTLNITPSSLWQYNPNSILIPFAVGLHLWSDGIQSFYRYFPYEVITTPNDALIHLPGDFHNYNDKRRLFVLSSNIGTNVRGKIDDIDALGVIEVVFNAGRPVVLRNIYVQSDVKPDRIRIYSRAGVSEQAQSEKKNDQYVFSVPNTPTNRSHIDISFRVRVIFPNPTNARTNLGYIMAVVSEEPTGPGSMRRL